MKSLALLLLLGAVAALPIKNQWLEGEPPGFIISTFECYVDNFGFDDRTFTIRVFTNNSTYVSGGPILFYTGNEGAVEMFINNTGNLQIIAKKVNAVLIYAEHRYFGNSMPFGAQSLTNPNNAKYLSPHQALADYARLVSALKLAYGDVPVIAAGGSYGGMLAAWFRIKYPHLIDGALAASAPLFHFPGTVDPALFNAYVTQDYLVAMDECPTLISSGFSYLNEIINNAQEYYTIQTLFNTCTGIRYPSDVQALIDYLNGGFVYMAMTDYPFDCNFLNPMPANPVTVACSMMALVEDSKNMTQVLTSMLKAVNVYYNWAGTASCSDILGNGGGNLGYDGWDYLSCSTLVMPMAQEGMPNDMFVPEPWDYFAYAASCEQTYNRLPQPLYVQVYFGTSNPPFLTLQYISNIIFSSGSLDPWQSGAVVKQPSANVTVTIIAGGAHHLDLFPPNVNNPPSVNNTQILELQQIKLYIASVPQ